jgi:hypothetical protein
MSIRVSHAVGASLLVLWWAPWPTPAAAAEPTELCRNLAARFARAPDQLDLPGLATLGSCITGEIAERVGGTAPSGVPREASPAPAPTPAQETTPQQYAPASDQWERRPPAPRQYGTWPPPAPWIENWPPMSPSER